MTDTDNTNSEKQLEKLWNAARTGDCQTIRLLVAEGVDVTARNELGMTALHMASQNSQVEAMRTLIAAKTMQSMSKAGLDLRQAVSTWQEEIKKEAESDNVAA